MKAFWNRIKNDVFVWLMFYFIFTLPFTVYWWEYFGESETDIFIGGPALDHIGGSPAWYSYYYWFMCHRQSCFLLATIGWGIYKAVLMLLKKEKKL